MTGQIILRDSDAERADVLAYLARRHANCALVARRGGEFAEGAGIQMRQLSILIDEVRAGMHEGEAEAAALRPSACTGPYPFKDHRSLAEIAGEDQAGGPA